VARLRHQADAGAARSTRVAVKHVSRLKLNRINEARWDRPNTPSPGTEVNQEVSVDVKFKDA
jgi:hypothetical protein